MKTLICMAVYDTEDNGRSDYTKKSLPSVIETKGEEDLLVIIDNGSCHKTKKILKGYGGHIETITMEENVGTAEAINKGIDRFWDGLSPIVKIDNDVVIHDKRWTERMRRCLGAEPTLGVLGLKRKDLPNHPESEGYPTKILFTEHREGQPWEIIELCEDIIGTCTMYSPSLMRKVGRLFQPTLYGFDDNIMCIKSIMAGFANAFYPSVEIDHIDTGGNWYTEHKRNTAREDFPEYEKIAKMLRNGQMPLYYDGINRPKY